MKSEKLEIKICKYFFDHHTAATLMIDDLAPVAVSASKDFFAFNDHGYLNSKTNSLFKYFDRFFLQKFPEVKGTFFILIDDHFKWKQASGNYNLISNGFDEDYLKFLNSLAPKFDFAFHGTSHGKVENEKIFQEFSYRKIRDLEEISNKLQGFYKRTGISFKGGKFPAYQSNAESEEIIKQLRFNWWAFHKEMKNKVHPENNLFIRKSGVVSFPTNFSGENFRVFLNKENNFKNKLKLIYNKIKQTQLEQHLSNLYQKRQVISVQEHFTTLRTNGTLQRPNVFTDLSSLERIFDHLRGGDIWYATCNEVADYFISQQNAKLSFNSSEIKIENSVKGDFLFPISISSSSCSEILSEKGEKFVGLRKNGKWIFNYLQPGKYKVIKHQSYPQ